MDIITLALCKRMGKSKADIDGVYPNLIAGGVVESEVRDEDFSNKVTEHTGTAYINSIKGNTIVWNQLVPKDWVPTRTFSDGLSVTNNNDGSYTLNGTATQSRFPTTSTEIKGIQGHKYYIQLLSSQNKATISQDGSSIYVRDKTIYTAQNNNAFIIYFNVSTYNNEKIIPMIIDLTQMFGAGKEPTTVEEFTSFFPLPYYAYNAGTLLSFNGTGIKTTGKNLLPKNRTNGISVVNGITFEVQDGVYYIHGTATDVASYSIPLSQSVDLAPSKNKIAFFNDNASTTNVVFRRGTTVVHYWAMTAQNSVVSGWTDSGNELVDNITLTVQAGVTVDLHVSPMLLRLNVSADTFEPYHEEILPLPIAQYFPNGMDGVGSDYDELTNTKASTRMARVDLGSLNWQLERANYNVFLAGVQSYIKPPVDNNTVANIKCALYSSDTNNNVYGYNVDKAISVSNGGALRIRDTSFSDVNTFKQNLSGVYLVYPLATPIETDVNLDLSYKTYEGGIEQLLPENGSVPVTSPMKTNVEFDFDENINALLDKMLNMIAPVETSPTSNAYSIGQYLIYDYVLYKVTSAIASGGTITVGTNVEATTIASVLESL